MLLGQVMYRLCTKGRAPRTKETLPHFREEMSGHPTFTSFHGLTGSQRTPENGASQVALLFKDEGVLATHPPSCHPWRVFGNQERERK